MLRTRRHAYLYITVARHVSGDRYRSIALIQDASVPDHEPVTVGAVALAGVGDNQDTPVAVKRGSSKCAIVAKGRASDEYRGKKKRTWQHQQPPSDHGASGDSTAAGEGRSSG